MRRGLVNSRVRSMKSRLKEHGDKRYSFMDSERFSPPCVVDENDHSEIIAEVKAGDDEGYEMVHKLNNHKLLVDEVINLKNVLLEILEMIPVNKIQYDDPRKDELLYKISYKISVAYYGPENE